MFASVFAARAGHEVHVYEKNEKLGKKLYITGKGRCNITNACDMEELFQSVMSNSKFLYSAFYGYTNDMVIDFFEQCGLPTKIERGNRVFPVSDHSSDVISVLEKEMKRNGVHIHLKNEVKNIIIHQSKVSGIELEQGIVKADGVLIATGGFSYQATGSTGDGYRFAQECGHKITDLYPSLVPMEVKEEYIIRMQGLSLRNVTLLIKDGKKKLYEDFGEMMFTHFGVTGPLVLTASAVLAKKMKGKELSAFIDLKPALSSEQLDARILREFEAGKNKQFKNVISSMFPSTLLPVILELSSIPADKKVNEISREERRDFGALVKAFPFTVVGLRSFKEAIITKGGVSVKEVNPSTME